MALQHPFDQAFLIAITVNQRHQNKTPATALDHNVWWKHPHLPFNFPGLKKAGFWNSPSFHTRRDTGGPEMSLLAPLFTSHSLYSGPFYMCVRESIFCLTRALLFLFHLFFYIKGISTSRTAAPERSPEVFELHLFTELGVLLGGW